MAAHQGNRSMTALLMQLMLVSQPPHISRIRESLHPPFLPATHSLERMEPRQTFWGLCLTIAQEAIRSGKFSNFSNLEVIY